MQETLLTFLSQVFIIVQKTLLCSRMKAAVQNELELNETRARNQTRALRALR